MRGKLGLKQDELAELLGVGFDALEHWETSAVPVSPTAWAAVAAGRTSAGSPR